MNIKIIENNKRKTTFEMKIFWYENGKKKMVVEKQKDIEIYGKIGVRNWGNRASSGCLENAESERIRFPLCPAAAWFMV